MTEKQQEVPEGEARALGLLYVAGPENEQFWGESWWRLWETSLQGDETDRTMHLKVLNINGDRIDFLWSLSQLSGFFIGRSECPRKIKSYRGGGKTILHHRCLY